MDFQKMFEKETSWTRSEVINHNYIFSYGQWLKHHLSEAVKVIEFYAEIDRYGGAENESLIRCEDIKILDDKGKIAKDFIKKIKEVKE